MMPTWLHLHDLLDAQIHRDFPNGDIRPWRGEVPSEWPAVETFFCAEEASAKPRVAESLHLFIHTGAWPDDLTEREKVWVHARLHLGAQTAFRLAVPFPVCGRTVAMPLGIHDAEAMIWLVFTLWEAFGVQEWLVNLYGTWIGKQPSQET